MALQGTLGDFGIADIFQLIGQQQKTGVLHLAAKEEEVHISLKDGNVVRAESASRKRKELLGHMLVRANLVTNEQLESALEEQKRTLRRLGDILVANRAIAHEALKEMTHLQSTETLYRLFAWKQGSYNFEQEEVEYDPDAVTPIRSESVLMEGFRRVDEWPAVRKLITSTRMTFERLKAAPLDAPPEADDFNLDAAFGDAPRENKAGELGQAERQVLKHYTLSRTVQQYIDLSRLGEFETCKALSNLCGAGYLKAIPPVGKDEEVLGTTSRATQVLATAKAAASKVAVTVLVVGVLLLMVEQSGLISSKVGPGALRLRDPAAQRILSVGQMERIKGALGVYQLEHGELPETLTALASDHLLDASDLQFPWAERYYYRRTAAKAYVLLLPLR